MNEMKPEVKAYFDTLPKNIQTSVVESGAKFNTVEQLKVVAEAYKVRGVEPNMPGN
ncbi:MAG: hypothetical protein ACI4KI_01420 [Candidatus Fimenecus sp.]